MRCPEPWSVGSSPREWERELSASFGASSARRGAPGPLPVPFQGPVPFLARGPRREPAAPPERVELGSAQAPVPSGRGPRSPPAPSARRSRATSRRAAGRVPRLAVSVGSPSPRPRREGSSAVAAGRRHAGRPALWLRRRKVKSRERQANRRLRDRLWTTWRLTPFLHRVRICAFALRSVANVLAMIDRRDRSVNPISPVLRPRYTGGRTLIALKRLEGWGKIGKVWRGRSRGARSEGRGARSRSASQSGARFRVHFLTGAAHPSLEARKESSAVAWTAELMLESRSTLGAQITRSTERWRPRCGCSCSSGRSSS